jgi:hypothetical protein
MRIEARRDLLKALSSSERGRLMFAAAEFPLSGNA